jgi:hypothetical protein
MRQVSGFPNGSFWAKGFGFSSTTGGFFAQELNGKEENRNTNTKIIVNEKPLQTKRLLYLISSSVFNDTGLEHKKLLFRLRVPVGSLTRQAEVPPKAGLHSFSAKGESAFGMTAAPKDDVKLFNASAIVNLVRIPDPSDPNQ